MNVRSPFNCTEIGRWLAHCDDSQQAELLNVFGAELRISCRADEDTQLCYASSHLDKDGKKLVTALAEYVALREEGA